MKLKEVRACAQACKLSYQEYAPTGFHDLGDIRFGLSTVGEKYIICVRGSANRENWFRNFDVLPARFRGKFVHRGFLRAMQAVQDWLSTFPNGKPVIFTGHSFGGAVATLLAEYYMKPCVTFGSPKVYVRGYKPSAYEHLRIVTDDDPVVQVPTVLYKHYQQERVLRDKDNSVLAMDDHDINVYVNRLEALVCLP